MTNWIAACIFFWLFFAMFNSTLDIIQWNFFSKLLFGGFGALTFLASLD